MRTVRYAGALIVVAVLVACSSSDNANPEVTAPPPSVGTTPATTATQAPTTSTSSLPSDTEPTSASTAETTTSAESTNGRFLSPKLGTVVDSVPGVDAPGEGVEISDNVWLFVPSEPDPDDASVVVPLPEDSDIITAYGRAMAALYAQVRQNPIPVEPSEAMRTTFVDGGSKYSANVFSVRNSAGQHLGFPGDGDILRPVVLADPRSDGEAFIFDCAISGSHYLNDDGTLAAGEIGGTIRAPMIVRLVHENGVWLVDDIQDDERACT